MRRIPRARFAAAAVGVVAAGLLSGCGVADEGVRPGVAAEVGGTTIKLDDVVDMAEELCDLRGEDPATQGVPVSGAEVKTKALQTLVLQAIADGITADRDIEPSPSFETLQETAEEAGTVEAFEQIGLAYFVNAMQAIGESEAGAGASPEEQLTAGIEAAQAWTADEGVEVNPVFPVVEIGDASVEYTRDDISVAVSDFAEQALGDADRLEQQAGDSSYAVTLPESQRCG